MQPVPCVMTSPSTRPTRSPPSPSRRPAPPRAARLPAPPGRHLRRRLADLHDRRLAHRAAVGALRGRPSRTWPTGSRCRRPSTGWAPTRWAATCSAGSSPPARCRCSASALMLLVAFGIGLPLALIAAERGPADRAGHQPDHRGLPGAAAADPAAGRDRRDRQQDLRRHGDPRRADLRRASTGSCSASRSRSASGSTSTPPGSTASDRCGSTCVHVLPSMATVVAVQAAQLFGIGLLIVAGLAFLGFGPAEPEPSWGFMIQDASELPLRRAVADGADRRGPRAHRGRGQRARRRHRRQGRRGEAPVRRRRRARGRARRRGRRPPADPDAILEVRDLTVSVDDGPALVTDVSFSPAAGPGARPGRASPAAARR